MRRLARYSPDFLQALRGRRFRHPETGNQVLFQSLPDDEQQKIYHQWAARQQSQGGAGVRETPQGDADVERRVSDFFEKSRRPIPDNPEAAMQLLMLEGVISRNDTPHYDRIQELVEERLDRQDEEAQKREKAKPWWKRMVDIEASQRVGARWLRGVVAVQVRVARVSPKHTKLHIFDFDGTLHRSPSPPQGYEDKEAWWSDAESLVPPHVTEGPEMWRREAVDAMRAAMADPDSYVVVMTGRNRALQDRIQEILESNGLKPDELITNPGIGNTSGFKQEEMTYLLRQLPNVREVEFWEDREGDLKGYQRLGEKLGVRFTPKLVRNYQDKPPPYLGVFLTPEAREEVLRRFPPAHDTVYADHVTLVHQPTEEDMAVFREKFELGQQVAIEITGYAEDRNGQVLEVALPEGLRSQKRRPHITLSVKPGVKPAYSNELLGRGVKPVPSMTIQGVLDGGPRTGPSEGGAGAKGAPSPADHKRKMWLEFLQTETRNPEYGKPGHHKERILRKTLYDAGPTGRREVMREWGPYLQGRRSRSR